MSKLLFKYKRLLDVGFFFFLAVFAVVIATTVDSGTGQGEIEGTRLLLCIFSWCLGLSCFYASYLSEVMHGKYKNKHVLIKIALLSFPAVFLFIALFSIIGILGNV